MEVVLVDMPSVMLIVMVTCVHCGVIEGEGEQSLRTMGITWLQSFVERTSRRLL